MKRPFLTALTAGALLVAFTATGHAQVTVIPPTGEPVTFSEDQLEAQRDVVDRSYTLRSAGGGKRSETVSGVSVPRLLDAAGADPVTFSYAEIGPTGESARLILEKQQATDPNAFREGPAVVVSEEEGGVGFLRPSAGSDDPNATDRFTASQGIEITLRDRGAIRVSARASPTRVDPGELVSFSASAERSGAGAPLRYRWTFNDGTPRARGREVSHRFRKRGSYKVVVGVTASDDDTGGSDIVAVQVGPRRGGPDREGGGTSRDRSAPDSGPSTGGGAGGQDPSSGASSDEGAKGPDGERTRRRRPSLTGDQADLVDGELLTEVPATERDRVAPPAARTGTPREPTSIPPEIWTLLGTAVLMALGAGLELRAPRSRAT